jgi:Flp pilus assembly protein TadG
MSRITKTPAWSDDGGATVYIVGLTLALFACAALVFDVGLGISAKSGARAVAAEAARTGAAEIDLAHWRATGEARLDPTAAETAALAYLADAGYTGTAQATTESITVTAETTWEPVMLGIFDQDTWTVTATQTAQASSGTPAALEAPS